MTARASDSFLKHREVRFIIVGGAAAGLLFSLSFVLASAGMAPFAASVIAYAVSFILAYVAQRSWTFSASQKHVSALPRYALIQGGCALFAGLVSHLSVEWFSADYIMMSAAATLLTSIVSFVLSSRWAFAEKPAQRNVSELKLS